MKTIGDLRFSGQEPWLTDGSRSAAMPPERVHVPLTYMQSRLHGENCAVACLAESPIPSKMNHRLRGRAIVVTRASISRFGALSSAAGQSRTNRHEGVSAMQTLQALDVNYIERRRQPVDPVHTTHRRGVLEVLEGRSRPRRETAPPRCRSGLRERRYRICTATDKTAIPRYPTVTQGHSFLPEAAMTSAEADELVGSGKCNALRTVVQPSRVQRRHSPLS